MSQPVVTPLTQALSEGILTRAELREFMTRSNIPALKRIAIWLVVLLATGSLIFFSFGTILVIPAVFLHGVLLVHHFSLQHECVHYTVFRTRWINDIAGNYCALVIGLPHRHFRYEHCHHHTFTHLPGEDPEFIPLPKTLWAYLLYLSALPYWRTKLTEMLRHSLGRLSDEERRFIPKVEHGAVFFEARAMVAFYGIVVFSMLVFQWWAPLWYWIVPVILGEPVMRYVRMTEHVGRPTVSVMRVNTRTNLVSAPLRFLCWNMNYHAEHHYVSSAPFHALPRLHEKLKEHIHVEPGGYLGAHRDILAQIFGGKAQADSTPADSTPGVPER